MMKTTTIAIASTMLLTLGALGCTGELGEDAGPAAEKVTADGKVVIPETKEPGAPPKAELFEPVEMSPDTTVVTPGVGTPTPAPVTTPPEPLSRPRKRVNIDQLDGMIRHVTGYEWTSSSGKNQFQQLAGTLGKPDLVQQTEEDLSPTILFQKFLADAARSSCDRLASAELKGEAPEQTRLLVSAGPEDTMESAPEKVKQNMSALLARFHGHVVKPGDAQLGPWTTLFEKARVDADYLGDREPDEHAIAAWRLVCVALITHPDFYLY